MSLFNKEKVYLDWVNNFLTVDVMAEHYGVTRQQMKKLIKEGKEANKRLQEADK